MPCFLILSVVSCVPSSGPGRRSDFTSQHACAYITPLRLHRQKDQGCIFVVTAQEMDCDESKASVEIKPMCWNICHFHSAWTISVL